MEVGFLIVLITIYLVLFSISLHLSDLVHELRGIKKELKEKGDKTP